MATLILTAVGTALGGPVGGAIGSLLGQGVDQRLFRAPARDGPRLSELAVQTSSYGTTIPKLFGRIRVAGTVIWATDLIETSERAGGGKGGGGTNRYSYAASFAVALSGRPIRSVGRIWAEGQLIRGAAGDWKLTTGFRLHRGGEDQPVDPLIASAEDATPAYRGIAYAVFERLPLERFGNRIPSLTFEVEADDGPMASGAIAAALCPQVAADGGVMLGGFAASGSVRGTLETLTAIDGGWWRTDGGRLVRGERVDASVLTDAGFAAGRPVGTGRRSVAAADGVPREIAVAHHDPARDYQIGVQRVRRGGPGARGDRIDLPAVIDAPGAKGIAAAMLARAEAARTRRDIAAGLDAIGVVPGQCVTLDSVPWRVVRVRIEAMAPTLTLEPPADLPHPAAASSGRVLAAPDLTIGRTMLSVVELPGLDDVPAPAPRVSIFAAGTGPGWRQASLFYSLDDGASWIAIGATAAPALLGVVAQPPVCAAPGLIDRASRMEVRFPDDRAALADADVAGWARGANLALVGDELLQFGTATRIAPGRWRLELLRRGLRGTEAAIGTQGEGAAFVLIEAAATTVLALPADAVGRTVRVMASGVGDGDAPATAAVRLDGRSVAPPPPVHLALERDADGATLRWTRRSRSGWTWADDLDAPLGEEREAYRVTLSDPLRGDGADRTIATAEPRLRIDADALPGPGGRVSVVQCGTLATSAPARLEMERHVE
ncbi:phage tail protein [Sphingomonas sp. GV3]|uniref:GTA baseplate fiber-binding domain-containing protein n=1 Tax=Sphingomonas sp. GV3 TaxID=3040671 RepID=UPI00280BDF54|nr:phage tail protein [Sphingomonas sp. GV3]